MTTYYVTKYALTAGILKVTGELSHDESILTFRRTAKHFPEYAHGKAFHATWEAALIRAEDMRQKRIKSAEKSLYKLYKMGVPKVVIPT